MELNKDTNLDIDLENIDESLFTPLTEEEKKAEHKERESLTFWQDVIKRFKANKIAVISLIFIILVALASIFVPMLSSNDYATNNLTLANMKPSSEHWFGTDKLGRDIFVRVLYGARYSLIIAFVSAIINFVIGVVYGGISGFIGGRVDNIMMRIVDVLYSIPITIYVILIMTMLDSGEGGGSGLASIIIALSISYWLNMARIVRGEVLQLKQQEFVLAAKTLGASKTRILFKHLIPNCMGQIIVTLTLLIPSAIFTEAFLSYIGLGIAAPRASLGTLANEAMGGIYTVPYQLFFPAAAICLIILAFNLLGDSLRDILDPKMKK